MPPKMQTEKTLRKVLRNFCLLLKEKEARNKEISAGKPKLLQGSRYLPDSSEAAQSLAGLMKRANAAIFLTR
jgi:hypothetical protein